LLHDIRLDDAPAAMQTRLCSSLDVHPLLGWAASDEKMV
jgi:4-diphosphocytidyl-2-C-methyl-D-erythritol kinase